MLRIEKVFLQGFKSFCDPTEVEFDPEGITAVVGPNGCGKSNLSEAISWVIGEQRPRALRGGKMEDVIFQGSRNRAASGLAEVILTMVVRETFEVRSEPGDLKPASTERKVSAAASRVFQEGERITVGRRLYRTGESEYEMNGRACRLREIFDLFAGTGLGGAHYAIIEQGRIGQVLSAKPLDRRALIEEAAGVSKFKLRQHAAELKLDASKQNLSRLTDITLEIERQRNSLKRQASRARRYQRLRQEMRDLMRAVYVADYRATRTSLLDLESVWEVVAGREADAQARIVELEIGQNEATQEARVADDLLNETRQEAANVNLETERARQQQAYLGEQLEALDARAQQFARDREMISARSDLIDQESSRLRSELRVLEEEINLVSAAVSREEEAHRLSLTRDAEAEQQLEAARQTLYETTTNLERWRQLQKQFVEAVNRSEQRLTGLGVERERALGQAEAHEQQRASLTAHLIDLERQQSEASLRLMETQASLASVRDQRAIRSQSLTASQRDLTAVEHRLRSLVELDERHAYFSEAVQLLLNRSRSDELSDSDNSFTTLGTLADHVHIAAEHEVMIETALQDELQYILVPSFDDAVSAVDFLKTQGGGHATFMVVGLHGGEHPTSFVGGDRPDGEQSPSASGEAEYDADTGSVPHNNHSGRNGSGAPSLLSLLGLRPEFASTFERALPGLAGASVVNTIEEAIEASLAANGSVASAVFVTSNGERVESGRLFTGGGSAEGGARVFALRREIAELTESFTDLGRAVEAAEATLRTVESEIEGLEADHIALDAALRQIEKELAVLREQSQQSEREHERIETHLRVVAQETAQVEKELLDYEGRLGHAATEADQAERAHSEAETTVAKAQAVMAELRCAAEERAQEIARERADLAARTERRRGLQNDINRLESEARDLYNRSSRGRLEAMEAERQSTSLRETLAGTADQLAQLAVREGETSTELEERTAALSAIRERIQALDRDLREARERSAEAREERANLELERVRLTAGLDHIATSCHHELGERIIEIIEKLDQAGERIDAGISSPVVAESQPAESLRDDEIEAEEDVEGDTGLSFWQVPDHFDLAAAKARLDELRALIDALGPINMMALEELVEIEERYRFLTIQKSDIEKAVADTLAAIAEIKRRSRERFQEAFHAINANFSLMFQELFGGGRGEMRLIDETDILESGIEIIAQPPGKRLQNVLLLSGGEKAMAAIALVLAIFRYRPSPFCILDEVDAPLDDVNIGRFADKVTELSGQTQFVIITHSRRTMEAAQTLYGVTMEDPGVSKLVSVRLA